MGRRNTEIDVQFKNKPNLEKLLRKLADGFEQKYQVKVKLTIQWKNFQEEKQIECT